MDGQREAGKRETADEQMEKGEKDEHLKAFFLEKWSHCAFKALLDTYNYITKKSRGYI